MSSRFSLVGHIVSVHCREEGCIGLYIPDDREISQGPRDVPRDISRAEGNLEVGGDVQPNTSRLEAVYGHSLIINPYQGMYQEIHPCRAGSIDSVKINTSLQMMREWEMPWIKMIQTTSSVLCLPVSEKRCRCCCSITSCLQVLEAKS